MKFIHTGFSDKSNGGIVGRLVVQGQPRHRIDVRGKQGGIILRNTGERRPLRQNISDIFVILFNTPFLPRGVRSAVEHEGKPFAGESGVLDAFRIAEFRTVVREDDFKEPRELNVTKELFEYVKNLNDVFRPLIGKDIDQHEVEIAPEEREEALAAFAALCADNGVHFNDMGSRVEIHVVTEIGIKAAKLVALVAGTNSVVVFLFYAVTNFSSEVDVSDIEKSHIDITVKSGLRHRQELRVRCKDMVDAVVFFNHERRDHVIDGSDFLFGDFEMGAFLSEGFLVLIMRDRGVIEILVAPTGAPVATGVADVGRPVTARAVGITLRRTAFQETMVKDFLCDCPTILVKPERDLGEVVLHGEELLDNEAILIAEMFVFRQTHGQHLPFVSWHSLHTNIIIKGVLPLVFLRVKFHSEKKGTLL